MRELADNIVATQQFLFKALATDIYMTGVFLSVHLKNAIMQGVDVKILQDDECREQLVKDSPDSLSNLGPNTICGRSDFDLCKVKLKKNLLIFL